MKSIYDKKNRKVEAGDLIKIFHFTGARRKKHYMYKHVLEVKEIQGNHYLVMSHLNLKGESFLFMLDDSVQVDWEILQGANIDDRPTHQHNKE